MTEEKQVKVQLHASDMSTLSVCGMRYKFRRLDKIIAPPGVAMIVGTGVHKAVEHNMKRKLETGNLEMSPLGEVKEVAFKSVMERWEEGVHLIGPDKERPEEDVRGAAIDKAVRLATLHHAALAPTINPTHVERKWVIELDGYPMDLAGEIDLQEENTIRDTKTASKKPPDTIADTSQQITMYCLAAKVCDGAIPDKLFMDHLIDTKYPKTATMQTTRTDEDINVLLARIQVFIEAIQKGAFIPCDPNDWHCSPKWCGYWAQCPYAVRPVSVPVGRKPRAPRAPRKKENSNA